MASSLLHLLPAPGWLLRPQHVRWCRRGELPQVPGGAGEGGESGPGHQASQEDRGETTE